MSPTPAGRALQCSLNHLADAKLKVDGIVGPNTMAALAKYEAKDPKRAALLTKVFQVKAPPMVTKAEVRAIAERVARETGVPLDYLLMVVEYENIKAGKDGYLIQASPSGDHVGLAQINKETWEGLYPMGKPFAMALEPYHGVRAIADLYLDNKSQFVKKFGTTAEYTDMVGYTYHNQGAPQAAHFLKTGRWLNPQWVVGQSAEAKDAHRRARQDVRNA